MAGCSPPVSGKGVTDQMTHKENEYGDNVKLT